MIQPETPGPLDDDLLLATPILNMHDRTPRALYGSGMHAEQCNGMSFASGMPSCSRAHDGSVWRTGRTVDTRLVRAGQAKLNCTQRGIYVTFLARERLKVRTAMARKTRGMEREAEVVAAVAASQRGKRAARVFETTEHGGWMPQRCRRTLGPLSAIC